MRSQFPSMIWVERYLLDRENCQRHYSEDIGVP